MPGRMRRAVEAAMAEVSETANSTEAVAKLILKLAEEVDDNGIVLTTEPIPILGFTIPSISIHVNIPEYEKVEEEENG